MVPLFSLFPRIPPRVLIHFYSFSDSPEPWPQPWLRLPLSISYCLVIIFPLRWSSGIPDSTSQTPPVTYFTPQPPSQTSSGSKGITLFLEAPFLTRVTANTHSVTESGGLMSPGVSNLPSFRSPAPLCPGSECSQSIPHTRPRSILLNCSSN